MIYICKSTQNDKYPFFVIIGPNFSGMSYSLEVYKLLFCQIFNKYIHYFGQMSPYADKIAAKSMLLFNT